MVHPYRPLPEGNCHQRDQGAALGVGRKCFIVTSGLLWGTGWASARTGHKRASRSLGREEEDQFIPYYSSSRKKSLQQKKQEGVGGEISIAFQPLHRQRTLHYSSMQMYFFCLSQAWKDFLLNPSVLQATETYTKGMFWKDIGAHSVNGRMKR